MQKSCEKFMQNIIVFNVWISSTVLSVIAVNNFGFKKNNRGRIVIKILIISFNVNLELLVAKKNA